MASHLDVSGDFHMGAIAALCDLASEKFRAVVQVRLEASGSTKHCVAIFDKKIVDPDDGVEHLLHVDSFSKIGIDKIIGGFMIGTHDRSNNRAKRQRHQ